jgi:phosphoglycerate kinase
MLEDIRPLAELPLENQRVFVRVDCEGAPGDGAAASSARLERVVPTIRKAKEAGARVVLGTRAGDPRGQPKAELGLEPFGARLSELLGTEIYLPDDSIGDAARKVIQDLRPGQICLLENLAFHPEEEACDEAFARKLAEFADVYVNDAPSALNRRDASLTLLPRLFRRRGMGELLLAELGALARFRDSGSRPILAVIGGARVAHKLDLLESLIGRAHTVCVGGVLGNTLLAARGLKLGASVIDPDSLARGRAFLARARERKLDVVLPSDLVVAPSSGAREGKVVPSGQVPEQAIAVDIGPETVAAFCRRFAGAKSALQVGALGVSENDAFASGTRAVLRALADAQLAHVIGGRSSVAALEGDDSISKVGFVSAGGDASLELLSGRKLPALEALRGGET